MLCAKIGWNWPSGSGEEDEHVKSLQADGRTDGQTDRQTTDDRWSEKLTWAFSSGELKTLKLLSWRLEMKQYIIFRIVFYAKGINDYDIAYDEVKNLALKITNRMIKN